LGYFGHVNIISPVSVAVLWLSTILSQTHIMGDLHGFSTAWEHQNVLYAICSNNM
jgi:hypothetical protein